jgi:ParB family protein of integrating conjugative element (PFGI_1 class)
MTAPKNPRALGLPITISATQAVENLARNDAITAERRLRRTGGKPALGALKPADGLPFGAPKSDQPAMTTKALRDAASFRDSYRVGDTTPSKVNLDTKDLPGPMLLEVTSIDSYDHNPRLFRNEKFDELLDAIKANGYIDALIVTRRRPGDRFMLAAGSNTTLVILKHLWETTGDEKYRWVNCIFQPYEDETKLLAQHLGENLNRGDMKFWEVAKGMVSLLDMIAAERISADPGATFSVREQVESLVARGLRADRTSIQRWRFTADRLTGLGSLTGVITASSVNNVFLPRLNALKGLASKFKLSEDGFWSLVVEPTLRVASQSAEREGVETFNPDSICDQVDAAFAEHIGDSLGAVRQMLSLLKLSPELTLADLRVPSPNAVVGPQGFQSPAAALTDRGQTEPETTLASASMPPVVVGKQAPLPIGPGAVSGPGVHPPAPPKRAPSAPTASAAEIQPSAIGSLFTEATPDGDPLKALHEAVKQLLDTAGLSDTLRWCDEMPLGFYVELPDPVIHARRKVALGSPEFEARAIKTTVWWSLVLMSGQFREGSERFMDHASEFYKRYANESEGDPLMGTDIDNQAPEIDQLVMERTAPGYMRPAMMQMRRAEECASRVYETLPERWLRMLEIYRARI